MRLRLRKPDVGGRHAQICALPRAPRKTSPIGLGQSAIPRRRHLRALHALRRSDGGSGLHRRAKIGKISRTRKGAGVKAPNSKHQHPENSQTSIMRATARPWRLTLGSSLELGVWNFELFHTFSPSPPNAPARDMSRILRSTAAIRAMEKDFNAKTQVSKGAEISAEPGIEIHTLKPSPDAQS
jgi:hypothetical protein